MRNSLKYWFLKNSDFFDLESLKKKELVEYYTKGGGVEVRIGRFSTKIMSPFLWMNINRFLHGFLSEFLHRFFFDFFNGFFSACLNGFFDTFLHGFLHRFFFEFFNGFFSACLNRFFDAFLRGFLDEPLHRIFLSSSTNSSWTLLSVRLIWQSGCFHDCSDSNVNAFLMFGKKINI